MTSLGPLRLLARSGIASRRPPHGFAMQKRQPQRYVDKRQAANGHGPRFQRPDLTSLWRRRRLLTRRQNRPDRERGGRSGCHINNVAWFAGSVDHGANGDATADSGRHDHRGHAASHVGGRSQNHRTLAGSRETQSRRPCESHAPPSRSGGHPRAEWFCHRRSPRRLKTPASLPRWVVPSFNVTRTSFPTACVGSGKRGGSGTMSVVRSATRRPARGARPAVDLARSAPNAKRAPPYAARRRRHPEFASDQELWRQTCVRPSTGLRDRPRPYRSGGFRAQEGR